MPCNSAPANCMGIVSSNAEAGQGRPMSQPPLTGTDLPPARQRRHVGERGRLCAESAPRPKSNGLTALLGGCYLEWRIISLG